MIRHDKVKLIQKASTTFIEEYDLVIRKTKTPRLSFDNLSQVPVGITSCYDEEYLLSDVRRV